MPFNALLGIRLAKVHADGVTIECVMRDSLRNGAGSMHGGVAATMADVAAGIALIRHFGGLRHVVTVELKINYFMPVMEGKIFARAYLLRTGSTICAGRVDLRDAGSNLIGTALATYMLLGARNG